MFESLINGDLRSAIMSLPFDLSEGYEINGRGVVIAGTVGRSLIAYTQAPCACGEPSHGTRDDIIVQVYDSPEDAQQALRNGMESAIQQARMIAEMTGQESILAPISL